MPVTSVWILAKANITVSGGGSLDGVTRGDGAQLLGRTITLNRGRFVETRINDNDANFEDNDTNQTLSGAQTINGVRYASGTVVEAEFSVILRDPSTGQTWRVIAFNVNNSSPAFATTEGLAFIGPQQGWPPVGIPLTVVSAGEGPTGTPGTPYSTYVTPACFTPGTRLDTPQGPRLVQDIAAGDLVSTLDHGAQPVLYAARTTITAARLHREPHLRPVLIAKDAFGPGLPTRDMLVSPQHRFIRRGAACQLYFGTDEVLVAAKDLALAGPVPLASLPQGVTYLHIAFAAHQVVFSDGLESESFLIGPAVYAGAPAAVQRELQTLFPELAGHSNARWQSAARPALRAWEARLLAA
jgi:hypothetical protein